MGLFHASILSVSLPLWLGCEALHFWESEGFSGKVFTVSFTRLLSWLFVVCSAGLETGFSNIQVSRYCGGGHW